MEMGDRSRLPAGLAVLSLTSLSFKTIKERGVGVGEGK